VIPLTLAEIAMAVEGRLVGGDPATVVTGPVEFDSRQVGPGGLFVAFVGERVDGHDFAGAAVAAGAVAVLGTRPVAAPTIVVSDPRQALGALARASVDRLPGLRIVAVTGSSGKTSTKDLLGQLLARLGPTVVAAGSFNNELGLPHTVLRADAKTRFLVLEMGARGPGHLTYLCGIAPPDVGVVVNVGVAHIGEFGSVEAIAAAKTELVRALAADGLAVLNADDERVRAMAPHTDAEVLLVGEAEDAAVRAEKIRLDERGRASFRLLTADGSTAVELAVSGRHQVANALLAAAVAHREGMPLADLGLALGQCRAVSTRRMDVFDRTDGVTVIDDSYNANPASTAAALHALAAIGAGRRRVAVLGYLAELGAQERAGHEQVGRLAAELGVDRVVVVGSAAAPIGDGAAAVAGWGGVSVQVTDQEAAVALLRAELRPGDVVLVKGSRYRTWQVADALRQPPARADASAGDTATGPARADASAGDTGVAP
jgi:UDP-N-acetylmuramoyl-tripeptide--D-alanyl-D-alanine ligase